MKLHLLAAAATSVFLLTGCAGAAIGLRSSNVNLSAGAAAPGAAYSSAAIRAQASSSAYIGMFLLGVYAVAAEDNGAAWRDEFGGRRPPQMAEDRAIAERDCSRPISRRCSSSLRFRFGSWLKAPAFRYSAMWLPTRYASLPMIRT